MSDRLSEVDRSADALGLNAVVNINQLPVELLASIFDWLSMRDVMTCSHVCQWWRTTALGDPQLWQNIQISLSLLPMELNPSPKEMLSRSQNQPMALHLVFPFEITREACGVFADDVRPHIHRLIELRVTMAPGRVAIVLQPVIDLLELPGRAPNLKSLDLLIEVDRGMAGIHLECPPLDHLGSLVAYSIQGPVAYTYGMGPITPRLRAIRLPESGVLLDDDEVTELTNAFTSGTVLEQLHLGTNSFYAPLDSWFQENGTKSPSPGGALRYVFWPVEALFGECDFNLLCRWTKARVTNPVHFAIEGSRMTGGGIHFLFWDPLTSTRDSGYIGHAERLSASFLPHKTASRKVNVKFSGDDGETWFLPRCLDNILRSFFVTLPAMSSRLVDLSIHESVWGKVAHIELSVLRDLTLFVGETATILRNAIRPPLDESDDLLVFLSIMDEPAYVVVPKLRRLRIVAFNNHPVCRTVQPMDDQLRVYVHLRHPATPVPVPAEAVIAFVTTHLVDAVLPLEQLVMRDVEREGDRWNTVEEGAEYAMTVRFESTQRSVPSGWVPFVFSRDSDLCEMYCTR